MFYQYIMKGGKAVRHGKNFENSTGKTYPIVLWKNTIGYYSAYDFEKDCSIYCGTMSEKTSLEQIETVC